MSGLRRQIPEETLPAVTHLARAVAHHGRRLSSIKVENRSSVCRWPGEPRVDARRPRVTKSADHQHFGAMPKIACHGVTVIGFHTSPHRSQTARRSRQRGSTCFASQLRTDGGRTATQVFPGRMLGLRMSDLTQVELIWLKKRIENWIRFGRIAQEAVLDRNRRIVSFTPGSLFAFVRWAGNDYGTVVSRIDILRAVTPGEPCSTVPYVRPGGQILLRLAGWPTVDRVLQTIDAVEALGINPADAAPEYWRHVHNRLSVNEKPRRYTHTRHGAWLLRRAVAP